MLFNVCPCYFNVYYRIRSEAMTALSLNGLQLADREIRVSIAKQGQTPKSHPSLLSVGSPFQQYSEAVQVSHSKPRTKTVQDHEKILRTIHIDNIDFAITEFHLAQYFGVVGVVSAVRIASSGSSNRKAWVEFRDVQSAEASFQLDNQVLGSHPIRITPSRSAIHTNGLTITPLMQQQMALVAQTAAAQADPSCLEPRHALDNASSDQKAGNEKFDLPHKPPPDPSATPECSPRGRSRSRSPAKSNSVPTLE